MNEQLEVLPFRLWCLWCAFVLFVVYLFERIGWRIAEIEIDDSGNFWMRALWTNIPLEPDDGDMFDE